VALLGGTVLYLWSLGGTRLVVVSRPSRLGVSLKLGAATIILALIPAKALLPPVALVAALAAVLAAVVFLERTLFPAALGVAHYDTSTADDRA
jgi:hypothetical protein